MSLLLRKVVPKQGKGKPYLACSSISTAGQPSSANLIPAILSIIFEICASLGLVEYPVLEAPDLSPLVSVPDETEAVESEDDENGGSGSGGSSFRPSSSKGDDSGSGGGDSSSSSYGSPDPKGKRVTRSSGQGQSSKRQRKGNTEPVSLFNRIALLS